MTRHILVVCEACGTTQAEDASHQQTAGFRLLNQLQELHQQWPRKDKLSIETTTCLCICDRTGAIAFVGTHKPTYLFGDLPLECTADLLTVGELYLDSEAGMVPAYKLPARLRPPRIARIPPAP